MTPRRTTVALVLASSVVLAACATDSDVVTSRGAPATQVTDAPTAAPPADLDCSEDWLGEDDVVDFTLAHGVVEGALTATCLGQPDARLLSAWDDLGVVVPIDDLAALAVFAGFRDVSGSDEPTLAFVTTWDDAGREFLMAVNLDESTELDRDELRLTMVHEFAHVLTGRQNQLDRFADPDRCTTWFNGEGCFLEGSLLDQWIDDFWGGGLLAEVDPQSEVSSADGEDRCDRFGHFLGAYAASHPEEDFAESFASWVLRVPVEGERLDKYAWFDQRPELAAYRDRAVAAGLGPYEVEVEPCG